MGHTYALFLIKTEKRLKFCLKNIDLQSIDENIAKDNICHNLKKL